MPWMALALGLRLDGEEEVHVELSLEGDEEDTVARIGRCPKGAVVGPPRALSGSRSLGV